MKKVASSKSPQQAQPSVEQLSIFTLLEQLQSETKPEPKPEPKQAKSFELRDYQKQVIRETYQFFRNGIKSVLVYAPTGAGKTVISSQMIVDAVNKGRRVMFCCHRKKLIDQTQQTLAVMGIESGIIWADHPTDYSKPVQICMIQTIQNRELPPDIGLVIFDECHSSIYYQIASDIMMHYSGGIFPLSKCYFIGLTATPWRTKYKEGCGKNLTANKTIYLDFLYQIRPTAPKPWIKYMMELEFGKPGRKYQNSKGKTYTATRNNLERKHWWMVLEVEPGSSYKEIKQAYRKLAKRWHPDICGDAKAKDMMTLINHAFEKAKRFCES